MIKVDELQVFESKLVSSKKIITRSLLLSALRDEVGIVSVTVGDMEFKSKSEWESLDSEGENLEVKVKQIMVETGGESFEISRIPLFRELKDKSDFSILDFPDKPPLFFFIGSFKVGKSKICLDVCKKINNKFQSVEKSLKTTPDSVINTTGEIFIHLGRPRGDVLVDTEGLNQIIKTKHSTFIKQYIMEHSTRFASMMFYIIDKFTDEEFNSIMTILSLISTFNSGCRFLLIHNIRTITRRDKLGEYMRLHEKNSNDLFGVERILPQNDHFRTVILRNGMQFEEMFCCHQDDASYNNMIEKVRDLIKDSQVSKATTNPDYTLNGSVAVALNRILSSNKSSHTNISFDGLCKVDVSSKHYDPTSYVFTVKHRKQNYNINNILVPVRKYVVSVPEATRDKSKIKLNLIGTSIHLNLITVDIFTNTEKSVSHIIFDSGMITTDDSVTFTNESVTIEENCCFTFLIRVNDKTKSDGQTSVD